MFFTRFILIASITSLEMHKPQVVEISPVEEVQVVKPKPKKVEVVEDDLEQELLEENQLDENNLEWNVDEDNIEENIEDYDPELYEEITFQDDFDKEYRNDVWDGYFEDLKENLPEGDSENIEDISE